MKLVRKLVYFIILGSITLSPVLVWAETEFNPNYLISDEEMQNWSSMDRSDIQAFLNEYESCLKNYKTLDVEEKNRTASDIIYRASKKHQINPKYLLVKLQKEQSLITEDNPTQKQLNGATGYGITDSCGWSCKTYLNNKGFGKQVDSAAGIIRWYYNNVNSEPWIKKPKQTIIIDGQIVIPQNYATAFLYTYTPHLQGNKNFWNLWQSWFGQVYPDGSLVKTKNGSTVYLIEDGQKRAITSMSVLMTRFNPKNIIQIPANELENYEDGTKISLPNYSVLKQGAKYYLVDYDTIRPFASYEVVKKLGYHPDEIIEVDKSDLVSYKKGKTIQSNVVENVTGRLIRAVENNALYYLKNNEIYPITDEQIIQNNFLNLTEEKLKIAQLANYELQTPLKFKNGTLIGINGFNKIYVIEKGKKRHIASEDVFNGFGYDWNNIIWTNNITGINHPTGQPIYLPARLSTSVAEVVEKNSDTQYGEEIKENGKMYTVPESQTIFEGETFSTPVNTYLIADYETGEVLAGKNIDVVRPLASFTKVMTAYRLLYEGLNLNHTSTYVPSEHQAVYHRFRTIAGEKFKNTDLFQAMLVSSLNTPAKILVDQIEPNEKTFIARMNEQAKKMNLKNTKFTDVYGYDLGNLSTAREYLQIFLKMEKNSTIREYLGKKYYEYDELTDIDGNPHHYDYHSNDLMNEDNSQFKVISSKTGYLNEAGAGLIMLIQRKSDSKKFVTITMGNPDYNKRFEEPKKIAEWAINNF